MAALPTRSCWFLRGLLAMSLLVGCSGPTRDPAPVASVTVATERPASSAVASTSSKPPSASARPPEKPQGPTLEIEGAVWSPDRKLIATLVDLHVHLWNGDTKAHIARLDDDSMCEVVVFSPDGKRLFVGHVNAPPAVFDDLANPKAARFFSLPKGIPAEGDRGSGKLAISDDGAWLAGRCDTLHVCLWDTKTGAGRKWTERAPTAELDSLAFEPGGKRLVAKNAEGKTYRLDVPSLRRVP